MKYIRQVVDKDDDNEQRGQMGASKRTPDEARIGREKQLPILRRGELDLKRNREANTGDYR